MRVIGEIPHPRYKITVFKMEHRLTLKFETGLYEQAYKFTISEGLSNFEEVSRLVDEPFLAAIDQRFGAMRDDTEALLHRHFPQAEDWEEEII